MEFNDFPTTVPPPGVAVSEGGGGPGYLEVGGGGHGPLEAIVKQTILRRTIL